MKTHDSSITRLRYVKVSSKRIQKLSQKMPNCYAKSVKNCHFTVTNINIARDTSRMIVFFTWKINTPWNTERKAVSTIQKDDLDRDASDRIVSKLRKDLIGMKKRSEIRDGAAFRYKLPSERPIYRIYVYDTRWNDKQREDVIERLKNAVPR